MQDWEIALVEYLVHQLIDELISGYEWSLETQSRLVGRGDENVALFWLSMNLLHFLLLRN